MPPRRRKIEVCGRLAFSAGLCSLLWFGGCFFGFTAVVLGAICQVRCHNDPDFTNRWEGIVGGVLGVFTTTRGLDAIQQILQQISSG